MRTSEFGYDSILEEAEEIGKKALIDPTPEMSNQESLPARAETMRVYFTTLTDGLMEKFRPLSKEGKGGLSDPQMRTRIIDVMEKGFEALILDQPSYLDETAPHHDLSHSPSETLKFSKEVFQSIREPRTTFPEQHQFTGGQIEYRLPPNEKV